MYSHAGACWNLLNISQNALNCGKIFFQFYLRALSARVTVIIAVMTLNLSFKSETRHTLQVVLRYTVKHSAAAQSWKFSTYPLTSIPNSGLNYLKQALLEQRVFRDLLKHKTIIPCKRKQMGYVKIIPPSAQISKCRLWLQPLTSIAGQVSPIASLDG